MYITWSRLVNIIVDKQKKFLAPCEFKGGVKNDIFFYVKIEWLYTPLVFGILAVAQHHLIQDTFIIIALLQIHVQGLI